MHSPSDYYEKHAVEFAADTFSLDLSGLYNQLLAHVPAAGRILDAGCGSVRDTLAFHNNGYEVVY